LRKKILAYLDVLSGKDDAKSLYKHLGLIEKYGISEGQQQNLNAYTDRKKMPKELHLKTIVRFFSRRIRKETYLL